MNKVFACFLILLFTGTARSQSIGINIDGSLPHASSMLDVKSTNKGFLPPRMTTTERNAIASPAAGLVIFNTITNRLEFRTSTEWVTLTASAVSLPTIVIGAQQWMKENLDVAFYRNGDAIPQVTDPTEWAALTTGAWCFYNNDPSTGAIYGKLYNWYAVNDPRGLAPAGWHIPTDVEWTTLVTKLGGASVAGGKMKSPGTARWLTPNFGADNSSGWAGLPGGGRNFIGTFINLSNFGWWWGSTENNSTDAWSRDLSFNDGVSLRFANNKRFGFSVRCIRD